MSTGIDPITAINAGDALAPLHDAASATGAQIVPQSASFSNILLSGLGKVDHQIAAADALVQRFALGEPIPLHQVTIALEQARMSLELAMQVRSRLLEGYREIMNMQL